MRTLEQIQRDYAQLDRDQASLDRRRAELDVEIKALSEATAEAARRAA